MKVKLMSSFLRREYRDCFLRRYDSLILLLRRFLSVACLNPLLGTLTATWAGEGMDADGIIHMTLKTDVVKKFPFLNKSSISLVLQSLSFLENVCLSPFSISECDFPGMFHKKVPGREAGTGELSICSSC